MRCRQVVVQLALPTLGVRQRDVTARLRPDVRRTALAPGYYAPVCPGFCELASIPPHMWMHQGIQEQFEQPFVPGIRAGLDLSIGALALVRQSQRTELI